MNGIHDCGGMEGLGPINIETTEPVFHAGWERRVFALLWAAGSNGFWNLDEFRHAVERMPAADYLGTTYYEHWLHALETLLMEKGVVSRAELTNARGRDVASPAQSTAPMTSAVVTAMIAKGSSQKRTFDITPQFKVGDRVFAKNINPHGHTRLPRYVRAKTGVIERDHGVFPYNDTHAHGIENAQHVFLVRFAARELWGAEASGRESLYVDLWEDHLTPAGPG